MPDAAVRVGGRYRLDRKLATGGMGAVWAGWDERLQRTVAVKRLHLEPWHREDERHVGVQRAMREARLTARLQHPNVVQVYDIVDDGQSPCLIMEYVPSSNLHQLVHERGPLAPTEVAAIGAQIAAGLSAAHAAGVVHRDMKPGNVLVAADGTAKVSDFGISHAYDDVTVTSTGILVGTPAYLAPEVVRGAAPDFAGDVYSLAATLYMAVEGRAPFGPDDSPIAVLHQVATGQWDEPQHAGALAPLLASMMALEPERRPTMLDVAAELRAVRHDAAPDVQTQLLSVPPASPPAGVPMYAPGAPAKLTQPARRRLSGLPILAALLVVLLGAVIGWALVSGNGGNGKPNGQSAANPPASQTGGSSSARSGRTTSQQLADAITNYFDVVPGDLNTGWNLLTPHFQKSRAKNWATYRDYWNSVDHVDVTSVHGQPPHTATANLVYYYENGQVVSQTTTFRLQRRAGVLKIAAES